MSTGQTLNKSTWRGLLLVLAILLPLAILFLLAGTPLLSRGAWFWFVPLPCLWLMLWMMKDP